MRKTILSVGILAAIVSTQSFAADTDLYLRGNAGPSNYDIGGAYGNKAGVMVGGALGYGFTPNVGVELGFNNYGKVKYSPLEGTAKTKHASLVLTGPVSNSQFSVYARFGVASTDRKVTGPGISSTEKKTEALLGAGVGYSFAKNFTGTLEYQTLTDSNVSVIAVGVKFSF